MKAKKVLGAIQQVLDGNEDCLSEKLLNIQIVDDVLELCDIARGNFERLQLLDHQLQTEKQDHATVVTELHKTANAPGHAKAEIKSLHEKLVTKSDDEARELAEAQADAESSRKRIADLKRQIYELEKQRTTAIPYPPITDEDKDRWINAVKDYEKTIAADIAKAVADERESCAKVAERLAEVELIDGEYKCISDLQNKIAQAIRTQSISIQQLS